MVATHWAILSWRFIATSTGFTLELETDLPTHLWLFYQCVPPIEQTNYKRLRGLQYRCGSTWTYQEALREEQSQTGSTTRHSFAVEACQCGDPIYFFLADTATRTDTTQTSGGLEYDLEDCDVPLPAVKVVRTATQSIPNNTWTTVTWQAASYMIGDWAPTGFTRTNVIVPEDGAYIINGNVNFAIAGGGQRSVVILSTPFVSDYAKVARFPGSTLDFITLEPCNQYMLTKGDTISMGVHQNSGAALNITTANGLQVSLALVKIPGT